MISINNLCVEFSTRPLFTDVSFVVNDRERIALMGKNGAGKSTMLKIIAGLQEPTQGCVSIPKETTVAYLPQVMNLSDGCTVLEECRKAYDHPRIKNDEPWRKEADMDRILRGMGFEGNDFDRPTSELSGGWRMRIELAKLLLQRPDVLLLDEPTNHLDIESIQWLEQFLQTRSGSVILVSHDRAFVNNVTTRTLEISCARVYDYKVRYDQYLVLRKERREQQLRAYENQQKEIADIKAFIERFRYQATKAIQVQSRIKQLEKIVPIEVDEVDNSSLHLRFTCSQRSGDYPVICEEASWTYQEASAPIFTHTNLTVKRGEKVAFVGRNGEGKSTMVKLIMAAFSQPSGNSANAPVSSLLVEGETGRGMGCKVGHNVQIGYFAQNQAQLLDGELTVFDTIDRVARGEIRTKIRDILGAFMFGGEASDKKVKVLSGGERTRLAMIKLLLEPVNLLILDEPTNHLDLRSKDVLKEAIRQFDGTVILVSHDRDFLDGLVERVYEFGEGKVREHIGGIYDFLRSRQLDNLGQLNAKSNASDLAASSAADTRATAQPSARLSYEEQKAQARQRKKLEKAVEDAEKQVADLEAAIQIVEAKLATPDGSSDVSLYERYACLKEQLAKAEDEWAEAVEAMEG